MPPSASHPAPSAYTSWGTRVLAWLIDIAPILVSGGVGYGLQQLTMESVCVTDTSADGMGELCTEGTSTLGILCLALFGVVLPLAYAVWNYGYRQGTTGSSIGKSVMAFKVVSAKTGQPIGFGLSLIRESVYVVAWAACGVAWLVAVLFPLWSARRQSLADKITTTVCVPLDSSLHRVQY